MKPCNSGKRLLLPLPIWKNNAMHEGYKDSTLFFLKAPTATHQGKKGTENKMPWYYLISLFKTEKHRSHCFMDQNSGWYVLWGRAMKTHCEVTPGSILEITKSHSTQKGKKCSSQLGYVLKINQNVNLICLQHPLFRAFELIFKNQFNSDYSAHMSNRKSREHKLKLHRKIAIF